MPPRPLSLPFSGHKARTLREKAGLTLERLALKCAEQGHDVHLSAISKIECGANMPSAALLTALATALECSVDDLLEDESPAVAS
jgi:transcriptional regulator with XRE-family HTH domain